MELVQKYIKAKNSSMELFRSATTRPYAYIYFVVKNSMILVIFFSTRGILLSLRVKGLAVYQRLLLPDPEEDAEVNMMRPGPSKSPWPTWADECVNQRYPKEERENVLQRASLAWTSR